MAAQVQLGIAIVHPAVTKIKGTEKHMKRKHMTLAATALAALLFLMTLGASNASADSFTFTSQLETKNASGNFFAADPDNDIHPVPDGGMTLMLLGGGLVGLGILRRQYHK